MCFGATIHICHNLTTAFKSTISNCNILFWVLMRCFSVCCAFCTLYQHVLLRKLGAPVCRACCRDNPRTARRELEQARRKRGTRIQTTSRRKGNKWARALGFQRWLPKRLE